MGYSLTQSAYLCLNITTGRIYTSRHVQFNEASFPFQQLAAPLMKSPELSHAQPLSATSLQF